VTSLRNALIVVLIAYGTRKPFPEHQDNQYHLRRRPLVILNGVPFRDGVIELELAGQPGPGAAGDARGFVGFAFRVASDNSKFECFCLRPTNGRADDQERRNHSVEYISFPDFPWMRLRKDFPEKYESYVDLVPGEWTKVKIEVRGAKERLFVHSNGQPTLVINGLKLDGTEGALVLSACGEKLCRE